MKQREIKIPLKCSTLYRLCILSTIIGLNLLMYYFSPYGKVSIDIYFTINSLLIGIWFAGELLWFILTRLEENEPILPFTFKCKCEDDKN